jgi:hypothetical protein
MLGKRGGGHTLNEGARTVFVRRLSLRASAATLISLVALCAGATSANAGVLVASAPSCDAQALNKTFLPWLDIADYTALSGGDFEGSMSGWSLTNGAAVASGNESFSVGGSDDANSLSLRSGSSATSAPICVGLTHPTVRFFVKRRSTGLLATLATVRVDVLFELADGTVASLPMGTVLGNSNWQPTLPIVVAANLLPLLPGDTTPIAFRFTAQGGDFSIDDVWVDPYARH